MSWEPAWVPDGRGGFRRNSHTNKSDNNSNNEDKEEGEESGEMKDMTSSGAGEGENVGSGKGNEDEEEGEIAHTTGGPNGPPRNNSTGEFHRSPFLGRGPPNNNPRFPTDRDHPRQQRNSFTGPLPPSQRSSSFGRDGGFAGGGAAPFAGRDSQALPPPPPPSFRDPSSFRGGDSHSNRDMADGRPPPRPGRDFRDHRGDGPPPFAGRDFRGGDAPPNGSRDFNDGPPSRDFRGDHQGPLPPAPLREDGRDFRDHAGPRDFRSQPGPPEPPGRGMDGPNRHFRGSSDQLNRDYRGGEGTSRDFRDRNDVSPHGGRDFRSGNPPPKRDEFGRAPFPKNDRPPGNKREGFNVLSPFGSGKPPALRDQPPYRDGPVRSTTFREGEPPYRESASSEGSFRDGPRDIPFRDGPVRDARGIPPKEHLFHGVSRDRDVPFNKRDRPMPAGPRDASRESTFVNRDQYGRGESHADRSRLGDGPPFTNKKDDHQREPSFGSGIPPESNFGPLGGSSAVQRTTQPFRGDTLASPSSFPPSSATTVAGFGLPATSPAVSTRPTDPRRRPSKEPVVTSSNQQGVSSSLLSQEGGGKPAASTNSSQDTSEDAKLIPPPSHPARRMGSYSSLADSSGSASATIVPHPPSQLDRGSNGGSRHDQGPFHSPVPRRPSSDAMSPRNERGDHHGPPGSGGAARLRSPVNERGRPVPSGASPSPNKASMQNRQQVPSSGTTQHPPFAPAMTGRPPHFRQNDPRFRHHERVKAEQEATHLSGLNANGEEAGYSTGGDVRTKHPQPHQVDPFGRTRDWAESSKKSTQSPPGTAPSSPKKKRQIQIPFGSREQTTSSAESAPGSLAAEKVNDKKATNPGSLAHANPASSLSKGEDLPPLLTTSLGDDDVVKRAEAAVKELEAVISTPTPEKAENKNKSALPTKQQIMTAVTELEKMIKETQKAMEDASKEIEDVRGEEEEEFRKEKEQFEARESQRAAEREKKVTEQKQEEENLKKIGLQKAIEDSKGLVLDARKKLQEELVDQISQAKDDEKTRCYEDMESQMSTATSAFDKEITRARRDLEKAKTAAQTIESNVGAVATQYKALMETKDDKMQRQRAREGGALSSVAGVVSSITAENKRKAAEAQMLSLSMLCGNQQTDPKPSNMTSETQDPLYGKCFEEWNVLTKRVTGLSDALYSEPAESPYYKHNEKTHGAIGPCVKEYIRDKQRRLLNQWTELAEEYEVRKRLYEKQQKKLTKKSQRGSVTVSGRKSILGNKNEGERPVFDRADGILEPSSRERSNNPYRRARRGNEVRSEYEQDLIIAEIAAKEAMEKRIAHGSSKVPRQLCRLERELSASYVSTFTACKVDDPLQEARTETITNVWSDMEKCIFFDRFLQFPKDFRRIASFLRNKSTKDCVAFYYDSKQSVPYKGALKEHMMRRKRRGDYQIWDASIQSALSVGATVTAGPGPDKPVAFALPSSDRTFHTRLLHPLKRDVLDAIPVNEKLARLAERGESQEESKPRSRKRNRDPLFSLEKAQTKYLGKSSQESLAALHPFRYLTDGSIKAPYEEVSKSVESESLVQTPGRKAPQKWTAVEKRIFEDTVEEHGRDWSMLAKAVGTKSISQIKNYYYDFKKQKGRHKSSSDKGKSASGRKANSLAKTTDREMEVKAKEIAERIDAGVESTPPPRKKAKTSMRRMGDSAKSQSNTEEIDARQRMAVLQSEASREPAVMSVNAHNQEATGSVHVAAQQDPADYGETNRALLHHLQQQQELAHHLQQQQDLVEHRRQQQEQQLRHQEQLRRQQLQQPQSSIEQALRQHHQREPQLDEIRRLLQQQQHSQNHQQGLSNLLPWVTASQLLQSQSRLSHHQDEINDAASIQRLLQLQQQQQGQPTPYGVTSGGHNSLSSLLASSGGRQSTSNSGISPALLSQLDQLNASGAPGSSESTAGISAALSGGQGLENLSGLAGAQGLLGYAGAANHLSGSNAGSLSGLAASRLYHQNANAGQSIDQSDALSLLTSAMSTREGGPGHGFGGVPDRNDGGNRY